MGEYGRFPWEPDLAALARTVEGDVVVEIEELDDPIIRSDVGDLVDPAQYPDATYWRFNVAGVHGKRFTVEGARVASVTSIVRDGDGFAWATRTTPRPPSAERTRDPGELKDLERSLALYRPAGWLRRLFLSFVRRTS